MSESVKENLSKFRNTIEDAKSEDELIEELGPGVEKDPVMIEEVNLDTIPELNLSSAEDVREIFDELKALPSIKDVGDQLKKHDAYQQYARKLWKIKQADRESFTIKTRVIEKTEKQQRGDVTIEKFIWKRDPKTRAIITQDKKFYYTSVTLQEKDEFLWLEAEKQSAHFALIEEGARVDKIIANPSTTEDSYAKYAENRTWQDKYMKWQKAVQDYWIAIFKAYFGATDDDIKTILFDDIVNYSEVALYKGGVKSPK